MSERIANIVRCLNVDLHDARLASFSFICACGIGLLGLN